MSICFYASIHKNCLKKEILYKIISDYFAPTNQIFQHKSEKCIHYSGFDENNSIIISFIEQTAPHYNIYISDILNKEFHYSQEIIFDVAKEECCTEKYKSIIDFCIFLKSKIDSDMLITSDVHDEICFIYSNNTIRVKNESIKKLYF